MQLAKNVIGHDGRLPRGSSLKARAPIPSLTATAPICANALDHARSLQVPGSTVTKRASGVSSGIFVHVRHRFGAADPGPVIRRALLDIWEVKSSILERSSLRIGEVFALL